MLTRKVDLPAAHLQLDPSILGEAVLGDIEPGHHLDSGDQSAIDILWAAHGASAGRHRSGSGRRGRLQRLEVDIGSPLLNRFSISITLSIRITGESVLLL